jgi:transposase
MQGKKAYNEKLFLSFQLSQRVPESNFYRRLKNTLDLRFISQQTKLYYGSEGQQSIDPEVFFKLMLVGYLENLNSDRKIIEHACMRLDILFFIGYDLDEQLPWHSTLSRTRKLYGEDIFLSLFRKILALCISKGMVSGKRQAIDSAFVKANASTNSLVEKEVIADAGAYVDELDENNEERPVVTAQRKKMVEQHHAWKKKAYRGMPGHRAKEKPETDEDGNRYRPRYLSNHTHYSPTDPDARISTKPGKPRQLNYTGQISVDSKSHVICGAMADFADKRDSQSLPAILANTIDNLKAHDIKINEVIADTGYSSGGALKALEFHHVKGYIPNFGQYKPTREGFTFDPQNDRYICSQGAFVSYKKTYADAKGNIKKHYRASSLDCKMCPLRPTCIGKSFEKTIEDAIDKPYYDRMHERMQTDKAKIMRKLRQSTVEPVLGTLINFLNMKRINARGISQANKHVLMAALAYNLKKYMNYSIKVRNVKAIELLEAFKNAAISVLSDLISNIFHFLGIAGQFFCLSKFMY